MELRRHAGGVPGVCQTMQTMKELVNAAYLDPVIRDQAVAATAHCQRQKRCQCASLLAWVKRKMHYVADPADVEALHNPVLIARAIAAGRQVYGDCDDFSMYLAALLKSIGLRPTLRAVGYNRGPFQHIYVSCEGMSLDATRDEWNISIGAMFPETSHLELGV